MNVSWVEAWRLWFSGKPLAAGTDLWGLSFTWWGRIGKILEFMAAYGVIVEIAGPKRLRKYGESLRHLVPKSTIDKTFHSARGWAWANVKFLLSWPGSEAEDRALEESMSPDRIDNVNFFTAAILTAPIIIWLGLNEISWLGKGFEKVAVLVVAGLFFYPLCLFIVAPLLTYAFLGFLNIAGSTIDIIFFRSIATVLEYKELDEAVKIGSLVILAIGFQFDLLAT